jgi:hypothetical protein
LLNEARLLLPLIAEALHAVEELLLPPIAQALLVLEQQFTAPRATRRR